MKKIDLAGKRFGWLIVVSQAATGKHGHIMWECLCDCGNKTIVTTGRLHSGHTKSCGCLKNKARHGHARRKNSLSSTYSSWLHLRDRCNNSQADKFSYYGGRGIKVCKRWDKFENFLADMGDKPKGLTIERIDNNKGYFPENCKWVTRKAQTRNRRNNRLITYKNKTQCMVEWAEEYKIKPKVLWDRLQRHPVHVALTM